MRVRDFSSKVIWKGQEGVFFQWDTHKVKPFICENKYISGHYNHELPLEESILCSPFSKSDRLQSCHSTDLWELVSLAACAASPREGKQAIHPSPGCLEIIKEPMPESASLTYLSARPHFQFASKTFIQALGSLFAVCVHLWSLWRTPQNCPIKHVLK